LTDEPTPLRFFVGASLLANPANTIREYLFVRDQGRSYKSRSKKRDRQMDQNIKSIAAEASSFSIDALHLDLRGISPATAQAAVQLLGPALTNALHHPQDIQLTGASTPEQVASAIAHQLARRLGSLKP
jgi:hypothetical protein